MYITLLIYTVMHNALQDSKLHYSTLQCSTVQYSTVDLDTMHKLHNQTMPTVLLHLAGHCEHKIT